VLRSYSLQHECGEELEPLLREYRDVVNRVLEELWGNTEWEKRKVKGKKQWRLLPKYKVDVKSKEYKKKLRESLLQEWPFAAHWVDSAIKTAYSILKSWRKNYVKGERKRRRPTTRRLFVRAKQTLIKLEGERLRVTIKPGEHVYLDLSKRYFPLPREVSSSGLGEPVITPEKIHLPVHYEDDAQSGKPAVAWDFNLLSLDGYSPETGWIRIDTKKLASVHISSFEKRRSVQRKASKSKKAKRILAKYSNRERNRARKHQLESARVIQSVAGVVGLEELKKHGMYTRSRLWNRMISRSDWRSISRILKERLGEAKVKELDPYGSSFYCSRCGWENKDLNGAVFECKECGLRIDRQLNAAINLYMRLRFGYTTNWEDGRKRVELKMEGASQREWWERVVLPSLLGGCVETGAELKGTNELVRFLNDALKPKLYYAYDRYNDMYLRIPT
jgi:Transposase and inactivated derivatives